MLMPSGHHKRFHPFERSLKFVLLDGAGRVNMLRANPRTFTNERASPDALRMRQQAQPFLRTLAPFPYEERNVAQVSFGSPFTIIPQLPQTPMRQDQR